MFRKPSAQPDSTARTPRLLASVHMPIFIVCLLVLTQSGENMISQSVPATHSAAFVSSSGTLTAGMLEAPYVGELAQSDPPTSEQEPQPGTPEPDPTAVVPAAEQPADTPPVQMESSVTDARITRLVIASVGIDASIEVLGIDAGGAMQSPSGPESVAWYDFSSLPHNPGNAVFAGHLDYAGYGAAIFWRLGEVQIGDVVEVHHSDGTTVRYSIISVAPYSAKDDAGAVVTSRGRSEITLITCDGEFDQQGRAYPDRLVVSGARID